jgi:D-3-phosphoglycerate dehydrogenase
VNGSGRPIVLQMLPLPDPVGERLLAEHVELRTVSRPDAETVLTEGQGAVVLIARSGVMTVDRAVYDGIPSLAIVSSTGSGADCFDVPAATERGIPVLHNPGLAPGAVAEYVLGAMVVLTRRLLTATAFLRGGGDWSRRLSQDEADLRAGVPPRGRELADLTLGVLGFGHIGRDVARRARAAFDMDVLAYDPVVDAATITSTGVRAAARFEDLLAEADIVTLHVPLAAATHHLLDAAAFALMKPGALVINAARGPIVDEAALLAALTSGHLGGAAIDVFDPEPPAPGNPLLNCENVLATPHIAGATSNALQRLSQGAATAVLGALRGERPPRMVADVWPPARLDPARWPLAPSTPNPSTPNPSTPN